MVLRHFQFKIIPVTVDYRMSREQIALVAFIIYIYILELTRPIQRY